MRTTPRLDKSQLQVPKKAMGMGRASETLAQVGTITRMSSGDSLRKGLLLTDSGRLWLTCIPVVPQNCKERKSKEDPEAVTL